MLTCPQDILKLELNCGGVESHYQQVIALYSAMLFYGPNTAYSFSVLTGKDLTLR
jgi:hypothetical protein